MAGERGALVPRPPRKVEYEIRFATSGAQKGWQDLVATIGNQMADAWDFLTRTPDTTTPTNYRMKGGLSVIQRGGLAHQRWQHKPTLKGAARIWFYVEGHVVHLEQVHTSHPNQTKWSEGHRRPRSAPGHRWGLLHETVPVDCGVPVLHRMTIAYATSRRGDRRHRRRRSRVVSRPGVCRRCSYEYHHGSIGV